MSSPGSDPSANPQPSTSEVRVGSIDTFIKARDSLLNQLKELQAEPGQVGRYTDEESGLKVMVVIPSEPRGREISITSGGQRAIPDYPLPPEMSTLNMTQRVSFDDGGGITIFSEGWHPDIELRIHGPKGELVPEPESFKKVAGSAGEAAGTTVTHAFVADRAWTPEDPRMPVRRAQVAFSFADGSYQYPEDRRSEMPLVDMGAPVVTEMTQLCDWTVGQLATHAEQFAWQRLSSKIL